MSDIENDNYFSGDDNSESSSESDNNSIIDVDNDSDNESSAVKDNVDLENENEEDEEIVDETFYDETEDPELEIDPEEEEEDDDSQYGGTDDIPDNYDDENNIITSSKKDKSSNINKTNINLNIEDSDSENEDADEKYLQKFDSEINRNYLIDFHPECLINNYDEIQSLTKIVRDANYNIIDPLHKTIPFLTKYEKTRIIGQRAKQINAGAKPFIKVPENVIDGYLIALLELREKRIPFIIRRPLPSGGCEYWNVKDLEEINF
jgi:DNA-directed RNA polymerase I, II, and III subunit RPABC2